MVEFLLVEMKDTELLRGIAINAFVADLEKYGALPPGIEKIEWHTSKVENGMYYKIVVDQKVAGGINLYHMGDNHLRLGAIFIDPAFQNQGLGSKAIQFIEEKYNDVSKWSLDTPYLNTANHRFYERHGYVHVDTIQPEKGKEFYLFIYEKTIG